jgi:hypothetical protein
VQYGVQFHPPKGRESRRNGFTWLTPLGEVERLGAGMVTIDGVHRSHGSGHRSPPRAHPLVKRRGSTISAVVSRLRCRLIACCSKVGFG